MIPPDPPRPYRPDIDGLRALAVCGVVLYHAGLGVPGGFIGVDVFFVISGFLITGLIVKDLKNQSFSLLDFWERRARRILPALAVVTAATLIAGWFYLMPNDYKHLGSSVIALAALASNIQFWRSTGYFAAASEEMPLLHTWSLSLEEQFYLLVPLFLMLLFQLKKSSWVRTILILVTIGSLIMAAIGIHHAPSATFFLLPFRAWELAVGSLLAITPPLEGRRIRATLAWIGLGGILVPYAFYSRNTPFPGISAIPPVIGTALLIWTGMKGLSRTIPNRLLAARPFVWIGLISYSLYLWHWPLFAYYRYLFSKQAPLSVAIALVLVSLLLAWASLVFVERPFRSRATICSRPLLFGLSLATVCLLALPSLAIWLKNGAPERMSQEVLRIASGAEDFNFINNHTEADIPDQLTHLGSPTLPSILVWGDSHAMAILPAVDVACKRQNVGAIAATASSTAPLLDWFKVTQYGLNERAPAFGESLLNFLQSSSGDRGISTVILAARWTSYLEPSSEREAFRAALEKTIHKIQSVGCTVYIFREIPAFTTSIPKANALFHNLSWPSLLPKIDPHWDSIRTQGLNEIFLEITSDCPGVRFIDPLPAFSSENGEVHLLDPEGYSTYRDAHHISTHGSLLLVAPIEDVINQARMTGKKSYTK
jgi:peptidoglycan/LPS O-acetylase OafA/YrhL